MMETGSVLVNIVQQNGAIMSRVQSRMSGGSSSSKPSVDDDLDERATPTSPLD